MEKEDVMKALESFSKNNCNPYLSGYKPYTKDQSLNKIKCFHSEEWAVGGRSGGSCWNDGAHRNVEAEEPKPIELLEAFLEEFYPCLNLAQYKGLTNKIETEEWCDSEYYGNYTNFECAYIKFDDIAEYLVNIKKPKLRM